MGEPLYRKALRHWITSGSNFKNKKASQISRHPIFRRKTKKGEFIERKIKMDSRDKYEVHRA